MGKLSSPASRPEIELAVRPHLLDILSQDGVYSDNADK